MDFSGKIAVVTGAASGIGRAIAEAFANEGARVALLDIHSAEVESFAAGLREQGHECIAVTVDVRRADDVERAYQDVCSALGDAHILVNSAGVEISGSLLTTDEEVWDRTIDINLKGTWLMSRAFVRSMRERGAGVIINLGSSATNIAIADLMAYCASKGGVAQLTRAMALDCAPYGIRVNQINPGWTDTPMGNAGAEAAGMDVKSFQALGARKYPLARIAQPHEIANAALFLANDASEYITGAMIAVDGGLTAKQPIT